MFLQPTFLRHGEGGRSEERGGGRKSGWKKRERKAGRKNKQRFFVFILKKGRSL